MLYLLAVLCGAAGTLLFRRFTNHAALHRATRGIVAHWLEIRLYFDDPRMVWQAQRHLLVWHWHLLRACAPAFLLTGALTGAACGWLEQTLSAPQLFPGQVAVLTTKQAIPAGLIVEAGPLRNEVAQTSTYRVRASQHVRIKELELPRDHSWLIPFTLTLTLTTCATFLLW